MSEKPGWFSRAFARPKINTPSETKQAPSPAQSGFVALHTTLGAGWTTASYSALSTEGFMRNPIAHRCVRMIAESAGALPWLVYDGEEEAEGHPALKLINQPNPLTARSAFIERICGHLLLSGNAYLEHAPGSEGRFGQIYALRPDRVTCETDERGWPSAYSYQAAATKRRIEINSGDDIAPVLHLKLFHPLDDLNGFAPLQAALMSLDTHNATASWNKALLDNAARPSGALVYATNDGLGLAPDQLERLRGELENKYSGAQNAGKPMLLEGDLDWKAMGLSPKDMDFIEAKNAASRDIALALGVPPMLLGIPGDNTYANYQEAHRAFFRLTVLPMIRRIVDAMGSWLSAGETKPFRFDVDLDQAESLNAERSDLWTRLEAASFLTDDEKRIAVGYSPLTEE